MARRNARKHDDAGLLPPGERMTVKECRAHLSNEGYAPSVVYSGDHDVTVRGPYLRPIAGEDGLVVRVRSYYRIAYPEPNGREGRGGLERATEAKALALAKRINANLKAGLPPMGAPNAGKLVTDLIDAYLDPDNHLDEWHSDRSRQAPASFFAVWVRPVIGHLTCSEWEPAHSRFVMAAMDTAGVALSYRAQAHTYLTALANFGRMRRHGYLAPDADPMEEVTRPKASSEPTYVERSSLPSVAVVHAFADNMGALVGRRYRRGKMTPAKEARAALEQLRWRMFPLVVFYFGLRVNEALALRTTDFLLHDRAQGLGCRIERQSARGSATKTISPKHGSHRVAYASDELWDDVMELVHTVEGHFGRGALVWSQKGDAGRMVSDNTLKRSFFDPAAEATEGFTCEVVPQYTVDEDDEGSLIAVPLLDTHGKHRMRRMWNWTWLDLRHLYGTLAIASRANGGWGQDITDVSQSMGHRNDRVTWLYYVDRRAGAGQRMAAATAPPTANNRPTPPTGVRATPRPDSRPRLRLVG